MRPSPSSPAAVTHRNGAEGAVSGSRSEIEAAVALIQELFPGQLAACERLRDFSLEIARPWDGRALEGPEDMIVASLFARSSNTYQALLELCRISFASQAAMLNRSLFEDMVDVHWVTVEPSLAVQRYEQHNEHGMMIFAESARCHPEYFDVDKLPTFDVERRTELDDIFGPYGSKPWTGRDLHRRVQDIEHLWTDEDGRRHLHFFRRIIHRHNNQQLHTTADSLNRTVRSQTETETAFRSGPSAEGVAAALWASFWTMSQTVRLILDYFAFPDTVRERCDAMIVDGFASFATIPKEDLRGVVRNDRCPCGSGKKFKRCHGA